MWFFKKKLLFLVRVKMKKMRKLCLKLMGVDCDFAFAFCEKNESVGEGCTKYSRHSEDEIDLFFMCLHCGFVDILTSGLPRVAGVDGECDAVIGVDGRRRSPRCEMLLGPPWW